MSGRLAAFYSDQNVRLQLVSLLTNNRNDFRLLHSAWQHWSGGWQIATPHGGILILPQTWSTQRMAQAVEQLLAAGRLLSNELCHWSTQYGWLMR